MGRLEESEMEGKWWPRAPCASVLLLVVCADLADGEDSPDCAPESSLALLKKTAGEEMSWGGHQGEAELVIARALGMHPCFGL